MYALRIFLSLVAQSSQGVHHTATPNVNRCAGPRSRRQGRLPVGLGGRTHTILVRLISRSCVAEKGAEPVGKRQSYEPGTFSWVDLSTPDGEGAKAFYGGLFG